MKGGERLKFSFRFGASKDENEEVEKGDLKSNSKVQSTLLCEEAESNEIREPANEQEADSIQYLTINFIEFTLTDV